MGKSRFKILALWLLILAYAGQSFAAMELPCDGKQDHGAHSSVDMSMDTPETGGMQHPGHDHAMTEVTDTGTDDACDCCDQAQCAMAHCNAAPAGAGSFPAPDITYLGEAFDSRYAVSYLAVSPTTLYRPPISR